MIKKKVKSKTTAGKPKSKGKRVSRKGKKDFNPVEVRKDIAQMVDSQATTMAQAVIDEGKKGQLATVKYLFEVAEIYPPSTDGSHATTNDDSLAQTLMRRLNLPDEPVGRDEEDAPKAASSAEEPAAKPAGENEQKEPGSEPECGGENKGPVLM
jgi:hypothetical protein